MGFGRQWHQLDHMQTICTSLQSPDRSKPHQHLITQFLQAGRPSCRPTNSVKALKATALVFRPEANFNFQERETLAASVYLAEAPPVSFCCGRRRQWVVSVPFPWRRRRHCLSQLWQSTRPWYCSARQHGSRQTDTDRDRSTSVVDATACSYTHTEVNSALRPSGVAESSTSFGWGKGRNVTSAGWQVTLCDPMWNVSSRSGMATLRTAIHLLLTYLLTHTPV